MQINRFDRLYLVLLVFFGLSCSITSYAGQSLDRIVAVVNGEVITWIELSERIQIITDNLIKQNIAIPPEKVLLKQVLNKLILDKIQLQLAKKFAIDVDSSSINQAIADLAKNEALTLAEYKEKIQANGMNFTDFREQIKTEMILSRLQQREVAGDINVSSVDIEGYLNSPLGQDNSGVEYRLGHILISGSDNNTNAVHNIYNEATDIIKELKGGKDFKELAATYSSGLHALEGGDLGWRKISEIPTIFVKYVNKMQINEIVGPIKSSSGVHIIKLQDKRFNNNKDDYREFHVRQILIKSGDKISDNEALKELAALRKDIIEKTKDFAVLAKERSEENGTASKGGDLGWINSGSVLPEFWQQIIKLQPQEISQPFKTDLGFHLIQVLNYRDLNNSQEAIQHHAKEVLREQKFNELIEIWLKKIRDEAKVEILL